MGELERTPHDSQDAPSPQLEDGLVSVRFCNVPVRLVLSSAAALDKMLREVQVGSDRHNLRGLGRAGIELLLRTDRTREPFRTAAREALARGQRLVDVQAVVTTRTVAALAELQGVVAQLADLARDGVLLAGLPDPEVTALRTWWASEIVGQVGGQWPSTCPFPALPRA